MDDIYADFWGAFLEETGTPENTVLQNYTHRTKPTEYILQQKKEIRWQTLPSAETAAENAP